MDCFAFTLCAKIIGDFVACWQFGSLKQLIARAGPALLHRAYSRSVSVLRKLAAVQGPRIARDFGPLSPSEEPVGGRDMFCVFPSVCCRIQVCACVLKVLTGLEGSIGARCAVPLLREGIFDSRAHEASLPERRGSPFRSFVGKCVSARGIGGLG